MPLVPTTKMADARNYSVSGNHWPGEPRDLLKTTFTFEFRPAFLEPIPRHVFSINTSSSNTLPFFSPISIAALTHSLQCDSLIHQQTSKATKWINHANLLFLNILCLWDFFQPRKHQLFQTTGRNEHLEICSQHE